MANFQIKDFTSGLAVKIRAFLVNTDENVTVHNLVDTANAEVLGLVTANPAANTVLGRLKDLLSLIVLATGSNIIGKVGFDPSDSVSIKSQAFSASTSFTCGTTAYAIRDAVGASGAAAALTFASMGPSGKIIELVSASLEIDAAALIAGEANYELHLYNVTPPSAVNDSAAWDLVSGDRASYLGTILFQTPTDYGSTLYIELNSIGKRILLSGTSLFAYLVTVGAYTPTARAFKVTLHASAV